MRGGVGWERGGLVCGERVAVGAGGGGSRVRNENDKSVEVLALRTAGTRPSGPAKTLRHSGFPGDHSTQYWWSSITFKFPVLMRGAAFVMI